MYFKNIIIILLILFLIPSHSISKKTNSNSHKYKSEINYIHLCQNHTLIRKIPKEPMNKVPKISVIIPVYNGENFIITALRSIQNQNFDDYEIILIDDSSQDNSFNIIQSEAKKDKRIKIIKNGNNFGTLYTKAIGILNSKGKYLLEIDQDDTFCNPNTFKILFETAEKFNADLIHFNVFSSGINDLTVDSNIGPKKLNEKLVVQPLLLAFGYYKCFPWFWNKMYLTEKLKIIIQKFGKERYSTHIIAHEDMILSGLAGMAFESYVGINNIFYWHNTQNPNAVTFGFFGPEKKRKYLKDFCISFTLVNDYEKNRDSKKIMIWMYVSFIVSYSKNIINLKFNKDSLFLQKCENICNFIIGKNIF